MIGVEPALNELSSLLLVGVQWSPFRHLLVVARCIYDRINFIIFTVRPQNTTFIDFRYPRTNKVDVVFNQSFEITGWRRD